MRPSCRLRVGSLSALVAAIAATAAPAQNLEKQRQALALIYDAADRICHTVSANGSSSSTQVQGQVNAQVSGLARKLANIGVGAGVDRSSSSWNGVSARDLPTAMRDSNDCRLQVFNSLKGTLLSTPAPAPRRQALSAQRTAPAPKPKTITRTVKVPSYEFDALKVQLSTGIVWFSDKISDDTCFSRLVAAYMSSGNNDLKAFKHTLDFTTKEREVTIRCYTGLATVATLSEDPSFAKIAFDWADDFIKRSLADHGN